MPEFAYSIMELVSATRERDEAMAGCDHSWGYYGQPYEERVRNAAESLESDLRKLIRDELRKAGIACG